MAKIDTVEVVAGTDGAAAIAVGILGVETPEDTAAGRSVVLLLLEEAIGFRDELDDAIRALTEGGAR